jgi:hypothetical protein
MYVIGKIVERFPINNSDCLLLLRNNQFKAYTRGNQADILS